MASRFQRVCSLLLTLCFGSISLFAQITGDLQLRVADATEAVVPNATILVRNLETGATRTANTDAIGSARLSQIPVGAYDGHVRFTGFITVTHKAQLTNGDSTNGPLL